jgi:ferrous iron transport protein A
VIGLTPTIGTKVLRQGLPHSIRSSHDAIGQHMTLPESPLGAELRVTGVRLAAADAFRLNEMGIRLGTLAHVTQHAAFGGRVIAVAGSRYALDGQTAALIDVEPVERLG